MTFFVHDLGIFWSGTSLQWIIGESAGEGLLVFGVSDRWKVTRDMRQMIFKKQKVQKKSQKCQKMQINGEKLEKSVKKGGGGG